ncbi:MAG TPA: DUF4160 domain-containing protein [Chloroflexota bacterium]|nr:DUF4160 domain-containing protein [Chloroflexota bacterium]
MAREQIYTWLGGRLPAISRFYGILVAMYHREHGPPHFHVRYSGHKAVVGIEPLRVLHGKLPRRAEGLVLEWAATRQPESLDNWRRAEAQRSLAPIEPLD